MQEQLIWGHRLNWDLGKSPESVWARGGGSLSKPSENTINQQVMAPFPVKNTSTADPPRMLGWQHHKSRFYLYSLIEFKFFLSWI